VEKHFPAWCEEKQENHENYTYGGHSIEFNDCPEGKKRITFEYLFTANMPDKDYLKELKEMGFNTGKDIGENNVHEYRNNNEDGLFTDPEKCEKFISGCWEWATDGYRQYSPFEFLANELNSFDYPDEVWEVYDNAITAGIQSVADKYWGDNQ